jgi:hypothetical protein
MPPAEEFAQLRLKFIDPIQHEYEVIRPIVLFDATIAERSRQTDIKRTRIGQKAQRFVQQGMFGLADQRASKAGRKPREYPEAAATEILSLKQLYPRSIIERLCGLLNANLAIKQIITPSKVFWSVTLSRFNLSLTSLTFMSLKMPTRPVGR